MKKWLLVVCVLAMLLSLCACHKDTTPTVQGTEVWVDDLRIGTVTDVAALQRMLDTIKAEAVPSDEGEPGTLVEETVTFVQSVHTYPVTIHPDEVLSVEAVYHILTAPIARELRCTVKEGDTFTAIAEDFGLTIDQLKELNPRVEQPEVGQELLIQRACPFLQVQVVRTRRCENEIIPYNTMTIYRDDMPEGWTNVQVAGVDGIHTNTYEFTYVDGYETKYRVAEEIVIQPGTTCVMEVGTKK